VSRPRRRSGPGRTLWFSLIVWAGASVLALALAPTHILLGLAAAVAGGVAFGFLSAARLDGQRVRRRRSPGQAPSLDDAPPA
jgi:hypothetical protein